MQRKVWPPADTRSPLAAFVDEHTGTIESGDVGPLIGQAALALEHGAGTIVVMPEMHEQMNVALAGDAPGIPSTPAAAAMPSRRSPPKRPAAPPPQRPERANAPGPFVR